LESHAEDRVIATPGPCGSIWRRQECIHFREVKKRHGSPFIALARHSQDLLAMQKMTGLFHGHKPEEGADRREPGVATPGAVVAFFLNMGEEVADKSDVHLFDCQLSWSLAGLFARKLEQ
jgi:hypothetical protein